MHLDDKPIQRRVKKSDASAVGLIAAPKLGKRGGSTYSVTTVSPGRPRGRR